jgi:hypothetical protein
MAPASPSRPSSPSGQPPARLDRQPQPRGPRAAARGSSSRSTRISPPVRRLFEGGQAHLALVDSDDPLEAGLEIYAQPPGKRLQSLTLLSGGEQALTAIALIFALFLTNPPRSACSTKSTPRSTTPTSTASATCSTR